MPLELDERDDRAMRHTEKAAAEIEDLSGRILVAARGEDRKRLTELFEELRGSAGEMVAWSRYFLER